MADGYILDVNPLHADRIAFVRFPQIERQDAWDGYDICGMMSLRLCERLLDNAWYLPQVGSGWWSSRTMNVEARMGDLSWSQPVTRDGTASETSDDVWRVLSWLAQLKGHRILWTKQAGFQPKIGYFGLTKPDKQIVLRVNGQTRTLVFGRPRPYSNPIGVLVFKTFDVDGQGNPHPDGGAWQII